MELDVECVESMPDVRCLLKEHKTKIGALREACAEDLAPVKDCQQADNLFLLRFLLSYHGDVERAAEAVRNALEWRTQHHKFVQGVMREDFEATRTVFPTRMRPYLETIRSCLVAWSHKQTREGQPLVIIRLSSCNFTSLMSLVPVDIIKDYVLFSNEVEFWCCDRQTRITGKLHKCYRLVDLDGISTKTLDRKFLNIFGTTSKLAEFLHPQLVARTVLLNAPSFIRWIVEALKAVGVSKRALDKLWVHRPQTGIAIADHPDIGNLVLKKEIPVFFGGECDCEGGCVPGYPNNRKEPMDLDLDQTRQQIRQIKKDLIAKREQQTRRDRNEEEIDEHILTSSEGEKGLANDSCSDDFFDVPPETSIFDRLLTKIAEATIGT